MTVPVSKPALVLAKMTLLFLFSVAFMAVGGLVNLAIVLASGLEPVGFWKLFFVGIGQGIMMWAGALPCVLLVVLFEPQLHYLRNHHVLLHGGQLYFWHQRLFHHAALWGQPRYAVTRTTDLPLVLSVSGHIRRTDDGIDGADQSLLCDNAPGVPGRYPGIGGIPDIDRTGL